MNSDSGVVQHGRVCVVGLGYIGLPTAVVLADSGWVVTGVDRNPAVVDLVNAGELPFVEDGLEDALASAVASGTLRAQQEMPESDIYVVAVPTPFTDDHDADLSFVNAAVDEITPKLRGGELIVLESTSPPGTTESISRRVMHSRPDLYSEAAEGPRPVLFAHAPERVLPGRIMVEMTENDRIVGGLTAEAGELARQLYSTFCKGEVGVTDARTAEMAKLTENAFRDVNIAFANELSLIADDLGIDVWELIELANRHPRVNILQPGPGVGGHCIAVDPWFLVSADRENTNLIRAARAVNDSKPRWVESKVQEAIDESEPPVTVAVLGLAFKPDIDDLRESPALAIAQRLVERNPEVRFLISEPNVSSLPEVLASQKNAELTTVREALERSNIVALLVDHREYKEIESADLADHLVIDTRGVWRSRPHTVNEDREH